MIEKLYYIFWIKIELFLVHSNFIVIQYLYHLKKFIKKCCDKKLHHTLHDKFLEIAELQNLRYIVLWQFFQIDLISFIFITISLNSIQFAYLSPSKKPQLDNNIII